MPLYGHELSEELNPVQAGLGFALNLKDRDFIGRDAIANFKQQGGHTVRVGLQLEGRRAAREGSRATARWRRHRRGDQWHVFTNI